MNERSIVCATVELIPLGPIERRIAELLALRFGRWTSTEALITAAYVGRRDGGPTDAKGCIKTHCHQLRVKFRRVGLDIEAIAWCGRRLIRIAGSSLPVLPT